MPSTSNPAVLVAASASVAAGLIHAAAAGSHAELTTLATLFALTAVAQIGWAAAVLWRQSAPIVLAGVGVHVVALGAWLTSRTVGISAIDGLGSGQAVGFQDGLAVGLEVVAVLAGLATLGSFAVPRVAGRVVPVLVAAVALATVPAMATPHDHGDHDHADVAAGDHAHEDEVTHAGDHPHEDELAHAGDHAHDDSHDHDPGADDDDTPTDAELGYPASFVSWLDRAETPEQRAAAEQLIVDTTEAMKAFPDEAALQAAGFVSIGDGATGWEHYINVERIMNPAVLDPSDIESIVLKVHPDGTKEVASAMYLLPFGTTMADAPDVAGDLTQWHDHQNLCWDGVRVVGTTDATGSCQRGEFRPTQPMMHVWVIEHECGPFAGIEGSHGSGCAHHGDEQAASEADEDHPHEPGTPDHDH